MISVLFTGDFCPIGRISQQINNNIYNDFIDILKNNDLNITNLECPLCDSNTIKLPKIGPNLRANRNSIELLRAGGFNLLTLANNHILDYGEAGLKSTIELCQQNNIEVLGAGENIQQARKIYYKVIANIKIAIINFAENEFSTTNSNNAGANPLDLINNYNDIKNAKENSDYVFVVIHGGHEGYNLPSPRMKKTYRFFVDAGASAIICHHTHCYSGYEIYKKSPIFYSLGNFIFDHKMYQNDYKWTSGYTVRFNINKDKLNFDIHPYRQNTDKTVGVRLLNSKEKIEFEKDLIKINNIIADENLLQSSFMEFEESRMSGYLNYLEPFTYNKYYSYLFHKKIIPSILSKKKKRLLLNLIRCEAHRDMLMQILSKTLKNGIN